MFKKTFILTGWLILIAFFNLIISCKKSSDDSTTPTTNNTTTPASSAMTATIAGSSWSATNKKVVLGSNFLTVDGGRGSTSDSVHVGYSFFGTISLGSTLAATGDVYVSGLKYSSAAGGASLKITDTLNKKMTGSFSFTGTNGSNSKAVLNGTFTNVPF